MTAYDNRPHHNLSVRPAKPPTYRCTRCGGAWRTLRDAMAARCTADVTRVGRPLPEEETGCA